MGKYIWPSDVTDAARWYLEILKGITKGVSLDEFMKLVVTVQPSRGATYARLERLHKNGLITRNGDGHDLVYQISPKGLELLENINFSKIPQPSHWDGHWRIVLFDVPEHSAKARRQIRRLLKELGFIKLQLSAWIHPLPCLEQFEHLRQAYGIEEHIFMIETLAFSAPQEIIGKFQKEYSKLKFQ